MVGPKKRGGEIFPSNFMPKMSGKIIFLLNIKNMILSKFLVKKLKKMKKGNIFLPFCQCGKKSFI